MPSFSANKNSKDGVGNTVERLNRAQEVVDKAIVERKVFCIAGSYYSLREALRARGWVEKFAFSNGGAGLNQNKENNSKASKKKVSDSDDDDTDCDAWDGDDCGDECDKARVPPWEEDNGFYGITSRMLKNQLPNFIFTTKSSSIEYKLLQKDQIVNHYGKNSCLTTKNGLCTNLRNLTWYEPVDSDIFFPRCYKVSTEEEKQEFIKDFRITACQSLIKWILEKLDPPIKIVSMTDDEPAPKPSRTASAKNAPPQVPPKVIDIAVEQSEKYLADQEHGFIDVLREPNTLSEPEWDQFITWFYQLVQ